MAVEQTRGHRRARDHADTVACGGPSFRLDRAAAFRVRRRRAASCCPIWVVRDCSRDRWRPEVSPFWSMVLYWYRQIACVRRHVRPSSCRTWSLAPAKGYHGIRVTPPLEKKWMRVPRLPQAPLQGSSALAATQLPGAEIKAPKGTHNRTPFAPSGGSGGAHHFG
jgi:hypothetical protein